MSNNLQSLDDVLNGVESEELEQVEQATEEQPTAEPEQEEPQAVEPERAKEEEATAAPEPQPEQESWTKSAVLDERRKRQALQAELDALRQDKVEAPDIFENQKGYTDFINQNVSQQVFQARVEMSQEMMRMHDPKYDEKETQFYEMAVQNPLLVEQVKAHPMPARFVVDTVNKANELKKLENIDEYKAQLKAEVEAKVRDELKAEYEAKAQHQGQVSQIKPSLANARASSVSDQHIEQSLDELFAR